jgi:hypothetical protein
VKRGTATILVACTASVALVVCYLLLDGASYKPAAVADPCLLRPTTAFSGVAESVEQVVLSAADGAACALGASREDLILSLRSEDDLRAFARRHAVDQDALERAVRNALVRAVDDAEQAGSFSGSLAGVLRTAAEQFPLSLLLSLIRGGTSLF